MNVCRHKDDFGIDVIEWNFFATSHGKGPCDGIGGTVKRLVRLESLRRVNGNPINTFSRFTKFCQDNIRNIYFFIISSQALEMERPKMNERYKEGSTIRGTRLYHQFIPIDINTMSFKRLSSDQFVCGTRKFSSLPSRKTYHIGKYVAAVYDQDWYVGLIESENEDEYSINYMHLKNPQGAVHWPNHTDSCLTPINNILCEISVPSSTSIAAREYNLKEIERLDITKLFQIFIDKI